MKHGASLFPVCLSEETWFVVGACCTSYSLALLPLISWCVDSVWWGQRSQNSPSPRFQPEASWSGSYVSSHAVKSERVKVRMLNEWYHLGIMVHSSCSHVDFPGQYEWGAIAGDQQGPISLVLLYWWRDDSGKTWRLEKFEPEEGRGQQRDEWLGQPHHSWTQIWQNSER